MDVLHEDELFAIINKESGLLVHSDGNNTEHTVCNALRHHFIQSAQPHVPVRPLHRLDVGTSGILLFCKYPLLQPLLDQMMETHQIRRSYLAVVNGHFPAQRQEYRDPIGRDRHDARRMIVCRSGKPALTRVTLLRYNKKKDRSLVRCVLETGRTIRSGYIFQPMAFRSSMIRCMVMAMAAAGWRCTLPMWSFGIPCAR